MKKKPRPKRWIRNNKPNWKKRREKYNRLNPETE